MFVNEYISQDAHDLSLLIKNKQVSAHEVLECARERLNQVNSKINAVIAECYDFAFHCLEQMNGGEPYYGVPLLVKDLDFAIEGIPTTWGSRFFSSTIADKNSDFINSMISLGFVPFAKTNTPELGLSYVTESRLLGPCRNPYDLQRTAGGSSGGSAAGVAVGIAPVATANDGGGSIRIPAACCGVFGFKPTPGLIPYGPWACESWSGLGSNHVITRSVRDSADILTRLIKPLGLVPKQHKKLTITQLEGAFLEVPIARSSTEALEKGKALIEEAGHKIAKTELNLNLVEINQCTLVLIASNVYATIRQQTTQLGRNPDQDELEEITWELYHIGKRLRAHELIDSKNKIYELLSPLRLLLKKTDVVLTPALAQLPLLVGELGPDAHLAKHLEKSPEFTPFMSLFNQAGVPAMTIPVMYCSGLPISIQLGAAAGHDFMLLSLAEQLQKLTPESVCSFSFNHKLIEPKDVD